MGHRVLAVDLSLTMSEAAATHPTDPVPAVVADATRLPLPAGAADCAVAFMSLHDIDDMPAAVAESARILAAGGHLVFPIVHPIHPPGQFVRAQGDPDPPQLVS